MKKIAEVISWFGQPILVPTLAFACLLFGYSPFINTFSLVNKLKILSFISLFTLVFPITILIFLKSIGYIKSFYMHSKEERIIPLLCINTCYLFFTYQLFFKLKLDFIFSEIMLSISILTLIITAIHLFWKISLHTAAMGGIVGLSLSFSLVIFNPIMWSIFIISTILLGIISSARLYLNAHNIYQTSMGGLLGILMGASPIIFEYLALK